MNAKIWTLTAVAATLGVAACDVDKVEDGSLPDVDVTAEAGQLPEYEVRKTQDGKMPDVDVDVKGGELPEYEVETADVDIGTKEVTMKVPDVDVDMPDDGDDKIDENE